MRLKDIDEVQAGEWQTPTRKYYRAICCGCGLTHKFEYRLVRTLNGGNVIQFRCWLDNRMTSAVRRRDRIHILKLSDFDEEFRMAGTGKDNQGKRRSGTGGDGTRRSNKALTGVAKREEGRRKSETGGMEGTKRSGARGAGRRK